MASSTTKYAIYLTDDDGANLRFLGEFETYSRKEAIQKLVKEDEEKGDEGLKLSARITGDAEDEEGNKLPAPAFVVGPVSGFMVVRPKVETKVEVTF